MKREDKKLIIESLTEQIKSASHFYLTDISDLNAADTTLLRRICFKENIQMVVAKNTLLSKALEQVKAEYKEFDAVLKGNTSIMFSESGNAPAKLIKDFRKKHKKPILKAAYVEESVYIGDDQLDALVAIKSKNELIGDVIGLLQSPAKNVISALQSGGTILHGVLKTLSEKEESVSE
jgi:large subunit ribosomal protein L10